MALGPHLKCLKFGIIVIVHVVMAPQIRDQFLQGSGGSWSDPACEHHGKADSASARSHLLLIEVSCGQRES